MNNLIIAIFLYHGLTYPGDTITRSEINEHSIEIEETPSNPDFIEFYEQLLDDGITTIDVNCDG